MPWPGFRSRIGISDNYTGLAPARGRKNLEYPDALSLSFSLSLSGLLLRAVSTALSQRRRFEDDSKGH